MPTYREVTSKLVNILKLTNKDEHISRRFLLRLLQDSAKFLISQKWGDRSIISEMNLYSYIPCFEFEKVDVKKCNIIEFRMCNTLMKSVKPLPKLVFSRLGSSIREIISLDGSFKFTFVDEVQYRRNKKRKNKLKNEVYIYLGADNHLYIPDQEIYSVDLTILTTEPDNIDDCSACKKSECKSKWDSEFICPDKLLEAVYDMALQKLQLTRQIRDDQNPNGIEGA